MRTSHPDLTKGAPGDPWIIQAARNGDIEQIKKKLKPSIFKKHIDVNAKDERECTALHYAAKISNTELIQLLLDRGADIESVDRHGWGVLHYAVRYGDNSTVEYLLEQEADIHAVEKRGWNLLHLAARNGQSEKARILLENDINVNELQNQGWNALHLAVRYGQPDTISTLLEYGINIDVDNQGWTALQLAVLNGHTDIVSILLNKGANTTIINREGKCSLDIAREEGFDKIGAMILEKEFKEGVLPLPSPPPTPPPELASAPPLDDLFPEVPFADDTLENCPNTFDRWKIRLRKDLEMVSNDDLSTDFTSLEEEDSSEIRIGWKTFEEEKKELLAQLDKVKMREIVRLEDELKKLELKKTGYLDKNERQKQVFENEIVTLKSIIETSEERMNLKYKELKEDITQISVLEDNAVAEAQLMQSLLNHQVTHNFCKSTQQKIELINKLIEVQKLESGEMSEAKSEKYKRLESIKHDSKVENEKTQRKIVILEEEIENLLIEKSRKLKGFRETEIKLTKDLEKAKGENLVNEDEDEQLDCPVCLESLKPPLRIFQCPEGHILCENCKENPSMVHCPQCRVSLESNCSRNRALEEIARNYFKT